jgi:hypothetical protein
VISEGLSHGQPDRCCNIPIKLIDLKKGDQKAHPYAIAVYANQGVWHREICSFGRFRRVLACDCDGVARLAEGYASQDRGAVIRFRLDGQLSVNQKEPLPHANQA